MLAAACSSAQSDVPALETREHALNKTIMCPICPGESIDQSQATIALQMRAIVREKLDTGQSDDQIRQFFVDRYGPSVILEPPREGFSLAAWIIPPIGVFGAVIAFFFALYWMRRSTPSNQPPASESGINISDRELSDYYARIEAALEKADSNKNTEDAGLRSG